MTCIVGLVRDGEVWIGGDANAGAEFQTMRSTPKVFRNGEFVIGYSTSFRMGQLLQFAFTPPPIEGDLLTYMVTSFVDSVRDCLKKGGWAKKEDDVEMGGEFLIGVRGRLFTIYSDYQVSETIDGYNAVGCGSQIAVGAIFGCVSDDRLFVLNLPQRHPEKVIRIALEAAERFSTDVRGPFTVMSTDTAAEKQMRQCSSCSQSFEEQVMWRDSQHRWFCSPCWSKQKEK